MNIRIRALIMSIPIILGISFCMDPVFSQTQDAKGSEYFFPQVADGVYSGGAYSTSFTFSNIFSSVDNKITISFYKQDGTAWNISLNSQDRQDLKGQSSKKTFTLKKVESLELYTQGADPLAVGWAMVDSDYPVVVSAVFQVFGQNRVTSEGGVLPAPLATEFSFYATVSQNEPTIGTNINTGFAVINPSRQSPSRITASLFGPSGTQVAQNSIDLNPMSQKALFVSQLFGNFSFGSQFHGRLRLSSNVNIAAIAIRQTGGNSETISTVAVEPEANLGFGVMYDREPNDAAGTAQPIMALPMEIIGTMVGPRDPEAKGDVDVYSIYLQAGQVLYVLLVHEYLNCPLAGDLILRNSQFTEVKHLSDFGHELRGPLQYIVPVSGVYYLDLGCLKTTDGATTCGRAAQYRMHVMVKSN